MAVMWGFIWCRDAHSFSPSDIKSKVVAIALAFSCRGKQLYDSLVDGTFSNAKQSKTPWETWDYISRTLRAQDSYYKHLDCFKEISQWQSLGELPKSNFHLLRLMTNYSPSVPRSARNYAIGGNIKSTWRDSNYNPLQFRFSSRLLLNRGHSPSRYNGFFMTI